ncbi:MAG: UDP-glucose dehydrogenase family protein [Pseudobdellovibrionaceae bacterium]
MKVCVQGLWHLGSVTAAGLASKGHSVTGLDFNVDTIQKLQKGIPPLFEPGLEALVQQGQKSDLLKFSSDAEQAAAGAEVLWVAYDTPVDDDDKADVDFVKNEIEKTLPFLSPGAVVLISSQMPVGSIKSLEQLVSQKYSHLKISFAYSPENLRLGKALDVFLNPDRIIIGVRSKQDQEKLEKLLLPITDRLEWMSVESAEMTKHAINAFLATSVTFANELAAICELVGADAKQVERGLKTESRIGPKAYVSPGAAFAGGTLARDIVFLNRVGQEKNLKTPLLSSIKPSNDEHKGWVKRRLQRQFPDLSKAHIAVWGLTYKPGTDTLRRSLSVELCQWLIEQGAQVSVHDPAVKELPPEFKNKVTRHESPLQALQGAQALVVSTEWPVYREVQVEEVLKQSPQITVLDANRFLSSFAKEPRLKYSGVGSPS